MTGARLDGTMLKTFAGLWAMALAEVAPVDPAVQLVAGQIRQAPTQELLPDCAQVLVATGTAGPADEWAWALLADASVAAIADQLAPLVAPDLREPDGSVNALMAMASYISSAADATLANLGAAQSWQVMQGWQGLLERVELAEVPDGGMASAPGMEPLLAPLARPVLAQATVTLHDLPALELYFILDPAMVGNITPLPETAAPVEVTAPLPPLQQPEQSVQEDVADKGHSTRGAVDSSRVPVQRAAFASLAGTGEHDEGGLAAGIGLLLDVPLQLTVELGRTRRMIREVLAISPGSVVELDRLAGEPVDVLVNGRLLGKGEVVVINENFGVRITDIISPGERLKGLE